MSPEQKGAAEVIHSRWQALKIALGGIFTVLKSQPNARIHSGFTIAVLLLAGLLGISLLEWVGLVLAIGLVWMAEIFNTALEEILDLVHPERHPRIKYIKDISAGAVLISALVAVAVGLLIFGPRLGGWMMDLMP